jgi:hypothetical protein
MIIYRHPKLPDLQCFLKHNFIHFYAVITENYSALYESTQKKIYDEKDIVAYLDASVFNDEQYVKALLYDIQCLKDKTK